VSAKEAEAHTLAQCLDRFKESRTAPLSRAARDVLQGLPRQISGRVSPFRPGHPSAKMADACRAAGLDDPHLHDPRHEAARRFLEHTDLDVMEIKPVTGHKTLQMPARHTHPGTARLADGLAGMMRG